MKTDKYLPAEEKRANEAALAKALNDAKHRNPPMVLASLSIASGNIGNAIEVNWVRGKYWAGAGADEFACDLGESYEAAQAALPLLTAATIGEKIRAYRARLGWTQDQASAHLGMSRRAYIDAEQDARTRPMRGYEVAGVMALFEAAKKDAASGR